MIGKSKPKATHPKLPDDEAPASSPTGESGEERQEASIAKSMAMPPSRGSGISVPPGRRGVHLGIPAPGLRTTRGGGSGGSAGSGSPTEGRSLVVGREIRLSGEITSCERLVVEGNVEADLTDSRSLEISDHGSFKGNAKVEICEVAGHFQGELTVNETLVVKASGRIEGKLRYREMEIERGGKIVGFLEQLSDDAASGSASDIERRFSEPAEGES
jgi:cytoskeletal protein CcmA (bactofilin family)